MTASNRQQMRVTDTDGTSLRVGPAPESLPMFDGGPDRASAAKPTQVKSAARGLLFVAIASALSACASLPHDSAGPRIGSVADYASSHSLTAPVGAWPTESWWQSYDDAQLDALIREALAGSPNIGVVEARLRRAQAAAQIADAARRPQATASASATQQKHSYNYLTPRELTPQGWDDYAQRIVDVLVAARFLGPQSRGARRCDVRNQCGAGRGRASAADACDGDRFGVRRAGASACGARYGCRSARSSYQDGRAVPASARERSRNARQRSPGRVAPFECRSRCARGRRAAGAAEKQHRCARRRRSGSRTRRSRGRRSKSRARLRCRSIWKPSCLAGVRTSSPRACVRRLLRAASTRRAPSSIRT